jgi:hypothetical protein
VAVNKKATKKLKRRAFKAEKVGTTICQTEENKECFEGHPEPTRASKKKEDYDSVLGIRIPNNES